MSSTLPDLSTKSREVIFPRDDAHWLGLRLEDITSTDVAALFGFSPYLTEFEVFYRKKDKTLVELEPNERLSWGRRLESPIAEGIAEDRGWGIRAMKEYVRLPKLKIGSSFDFLVTSEDAILEIKNVDSLQFDRTWEETESGIEAPAHIELQLQHQLLVSGLKKAYIGALIGGNRVEILERTRNELVIGKIKSKVKQFWKSIKDNKPPQPDFERDSKFIQTLYKTTEPGALIEADEEIKAQAEIYMDLGKDIQEQIKKREAARAKILIKMNKAEKCLSELFTISAGQIKESHIAAHTREARRDFRINKRKIAP